MAEFSNSDSQVDECASFSSKVAELVLNLSSKSKMLNKEYQTAKSEYDKALVKVANAKESKKMDVVKLYKVVSLLLLLISEGRKGAGHKRT